MQADERAEYEQKKAAQYAVRAGKRDMRQKRLRTVDDDDDVTTKTRALSKQFHASLHVMALQGCVL